MGRTITDKMVKALKPGAAGYIVYDTQIRGFGVRVTPGGAVSFVLNYRVHGRERRFTIGRYPEISALVARQEALQLRAGVREGRDPLAERARARSVPTLDEFSEEYLRRHAEPEKRPISVRDDKRMLKAYILPRLGKLAVDAITRADIEGLRQELASTPVQANRVLALLHTMFELSVRWEYVGNGFSNPAHGIKRYHEEPRKRWVQEGELAGLLQALDQQEDQETANALRLILLTGSRKGEVLQATWDQFDLERGIWTKPSHATKQKRTEEVPLNETALDLLASMKASGASGYLFPGKDGDHRKDLKSVWNKVAPAAALDGVNIHDLRHTFASHLISQGAPLALVGGLLGHTQARTTQRYAHLANQALRNVTNQFGAIYRKTNARAKAGRLKVVSGGAAVRPKGA